MSPDACPITGETDCGMCSGEFCCEHGIAPCECDVVDRHRELPEPPPPEPRPCVFCGNLLECAVNSWDTNQPHGGGEVVFRFHYGSTRFDRYMDGTEFHGLVCDACAEKWVPQMREVQP